MFRENRNFNNINLESIFRLSSYIRPIYNNEKSTNLYSMDRSRPRNSTADLRSSWNDGK